jgi:hypothetical protein
MKVLIAIALVVLIFLGYVATRPSDFRVTRSAVMSAPAADVFAQVNNLHLWDAWSPWKKRDPNATSTFSGADHGVGAHMAWAGNRDVGEGSMTITESQPNDLIRIRLDFLKPFKATNTAEFTFKPSAANQTEVTWSMSGKNNFMGRVMCVFMNMDKMVGGDFEKGLASIKEIVEKKV